MKNGFSVPIDLQEASGIDRYDEPISIGIPFKRGSLSAIDDLVITADGRAIPHAARVTSTWPDGSIKWGLFDFQFSMPGRSNTQVKLEKRCSHPPVTHPHPLMLETRDEAFVIRSGKTRFTVDRHRFRPFDRVAIDGNDLLGSGRSFTLLKAKDDSDLWIPIVRSSHVESANEIRAVLYFEGSFGNGNRFSMLEWRARLFFYAGSATVRCDLTLLNPQAAEHTGGLWDLGDLKSILFNGLGVYLRLSSEEGQVNYCVTPTEEEIRANDILIYQDSSGGENWRSRNHMNGNEEIPLAFSGFRVMQAGDVVHEGKRATPLMNIAGPGAAVSGTIRHFWQNFPSAMEARKGYLILWPFPEQANGGFELQAGEQKTHSLYLRFSGTSDGLSNLGWSQDPLIPVVSPEWYEHAGVFPYLVPETAVPAVFPYKEILDIKNVIVDGDKTFFHRREVIDEYGWRNFGDQYADHENLLFTGEPPIISHYNNQYDLVYSFLFQFAATGKRDWFILADQLSKHVVDIDIYHTDQDKYKYNRGLFWHTDHYCDAHTATHRSYSRKTLADRNLKDYGGGPSYEHIYVQGLVSYYFMTGEMQAGEAAKELGIFASNGIDGPNTFKEIAKEMVKLNVKAAINWVKREGVRPYDLLEGPGRASGNTLGALLDAFLLTGRKGFLARSEYLIQRCVHPDDDLVEKQLHDVNLRWAYTLFFQSVGKYLDIKVELGETDAEFCHARDSLLHYADWMVDNECSFLSRPELLDYPNYATRACTDMRKNNVFLFAAKYSPEEKKGIYSRKAIDFYNNSVKELLAYDSRFWTRPLAILMQSMRLPVYASCRERGMLESNECFFEFNDINKKLPFLYRENVRLLKILLKKLVSAGC